MPEAPPSRLTSAPGEAARGATAAGPRDRRAAGRRRWRASASWGRLPSGTWSAAGRLIRERSRARREPVQLPEPGDREPERATARAVTPMSRATFRPHERITDPKDFRRAFERRRSASDATMIVYGVENGRDHPRLGISVGRKKIRSRRRTQPRQAAAPRGVPPEQGRTARRASTWWSSPAVRR